MKETIASISTIAVFKRNMVLNNKTNYLFLSMLGGMFVGFGIILLVTIGSLLDPAMFPETKIVQGITFGVALTMVILGGVDLFTGNNLVMTIGVLEKKTSKSDLLKVWIFSWIGNYIGSVLLAYMYFMTGLTDGAVAEYVMKLTNYKTAPDWLQLMYRGILCNVLVCLAVWGSYKLKNEVAKIILIFCCVFPFITSGFEHSVANMTLFSLALFIGDAVSYMPIMKNLIAVSIGNAIGGALFIGFVFWYSQNVKK